MLLACRLRQRWVLNASVGSTIAPIWVALDQPIARSALPSQRVVRCAGIRQEASLRSRCLRNAYDSSLSASSTVIRWAGPPIGAWTVSNPKPKSWIATVTEGARSRRVMKTTVGPVSVLA